MTSEFWFLIIIGLVIFNFLFSNILDYINEECKESLKINMYKILELGIIQKVRLKLQKLKVNLIQKSLGFLIIKDLV